MEKLQKHQKMYRNTTDKKYYSQGNDNTLKLINVAW